MNSSQFSIAIFASAGFVNPRIVDKMVWGAGAVYEYIGIE